MPARCNNAAEGKQLHFAIESVTVGQTCPSGRIIVAATFFFFLFFFVAWRHWLSYLHACQIIHVAEDNSDWLGVEGLQSAGPTAQGIHHSPRSLKVPCTKQQSVLSHAEVILECHPSAKLWVA